MLGSDQGDPASADVYGVRFQPFAIDRITVGKRVSFLDADSERLVVAAADDGVDRLAQITGAGELTAIPGLGRPFAYAPDLHDGVMYYDDAQGSEKKGEFRYFAWDFAKREKKLLFQTNDQLGSASPLGDGRLVLARLNENGPEKTLIRNRAGKLKAFEIGGDGHNRAVGRDWIAITLVGEGDRFGDKPEAVVLLDPDSGKNRRIDGLQVITWSPDGKRLLARRTNSATDSALVLLDPAKPGALVDVHTVPGLVIYSGAWVRGDAPASH